MERNFGTLELFLSPFEINMVYDDAYVLIEDLVFLVIYHKPAAIKNSKQKIWDHVTTSQRGNTSVSDPLQFFLFYRD